MEELLLNFLEARRDYVEVNATTLQIRIIVKIDTVEFSRSIEKLKIIIYKNERS